MKEIDSKTKGGQSMSIELLGEVKANDESIGKLLMKW
jgi:hypothetical protein